MALEGVLDWASFFLFKGWKLELCFVYLGMEENKLKLATVSGTDSPLSRSETNDCIVRALAAMADLPYHLAHESAREEFGRKDRQGIRSSVLKARIAKGSLLGKTLVEVEPITRYKNNGYVVERRMTIQTFFKNLDTTKTYLVVVKGHIFCIKRGWVVGGNIEDANPSKKRIYNIWEVK